MTGKELVDHVRRLCGTCGLDLAFITEGASASSISRDAHIRDVYEYHKNTEDMYDLKGNLDDLS